MKDAQVLEFVPPHRDSVPKTIQAGPKAELGPGWVEGTGVGESSDSAQSMPVRHGVLQLVAENETAATERPSVATRKDADAAEQLSNIAMTLVRGDQSGRSPYATLWDIGTMVAAVIKPNGEEDGWDFAPLSETHAYLGEQRWLWNGHIPLGHVSLCVGPPEVGKTFLAQSVALTVAGHEETFPDGSPLVGETGTVLWLDYEGQLGALSHRIRQAGQPMHGIVTIDPRAGGEPAMLSNPQACVGLIRSAMKQYPDLRLVVVDSLAAGSPGVGENSTKISASLNVLGRLASELGLAVMVLHHPTKSVWKQDGTCEITHANVRGSGSIMAAVRSCIAIDKPSESDVRRVHLIKASLVSNETRPEAFGFYLEGGRVIPAEVPTAEGAMSRADEFRSWLTALLETESVAASDVMTLALEAGFSKKIVNTASKQMVDEKRLRKRQVPSDGIVAGQWVWELVAEEEDAIVLPMRVAFHRSDEAAITRMAEMAG